MTIPLDPGRVARVRVPATSANLGPGFDHLGLGLAWYDEVRLEVLESGVEIDVTGEGADNVPRTRGHLVVRCFDEGLTDLGVHAPGVRLRSHNTIPHSRGLGSSSAAIVAGLAAAWLVADEGALDRDWLLAHADRIEGHPDNVAAAILGGYVMAWSSGDDLSEGVRVARGQVHPEVAAVAYVPTTPVATREARGVLPVAVPRGEAAQNAGRAALLTHAIAREPALLPDATRDWLHQPYRAPLMPRTSRLVAELREAGHAAFVSGAGPTVLVLGTRDRLAEAPRVTGFERHALEIGDGVREA